MTCVFCSIASGTEPSHKVLEDESHVAFLSIFPNTPGFTVVIPKKHVSSDVLALDDQEYSELLLFTKKVDKILRRGLNVDRCALVVEGMMVNHAHTKLIPMHGLEGKTFMVYDGTTYSERYEGYVTSIDGPRKPDEELAQLLATIHKQNQDE